MKKKRKDLHKMLENAKNARNDTGRIREMTGRIDVIESVIKNGIPDKSELEKAVRLRKETLAYPEQVPFLNGYTNALAEILDVEIEPLILSRL